MNINSATPPTPINHNEISALSIDLSGNSLAGKPLVAIPPPNANQGQTVAGLTKKTPTQHKDIIWNPPRNASNELPILKKPKTLMPSLYDYPKETKGPNYTGSIGLLKPY